VAKTLQVAGFSAWFVGGCVRDRLLGRSATDVDLCTQATPEQVEGLFSRCLTVGKAFGVVIVVDDLGGHTEVATYRTDGLYIDGRRPSTVTFATVEEDVARRDFTINALLLDPVSEAVVDHVGGQADIEARILRVVGDPVTRLAEDRLRVLRGIRFASGLGLTWDVASWQAACTTSLSGLSRERIFQEIDKGLGNGQPAKWLAQLIASGHCFEVLPYLDTDAAQTALAKERQRRWRWILEVLACWPDAGTAQRRRWLQHPDRDFLEMTARALGRYPELSNMLAQECTGPRHTALVSATDLLAAGLRPGPDFGRILRRIEDAQLEGLIQDKAEALAMLGELHPPLP
jgi:tRNA nucleotidyltransferase/poly(A) polymerase